jgi:hypothetical protein
MQRIQLHLPSPASIAEQPSASFPLSTHIPSSWTAVLLPIAEVLRSGRGASRWQEVNAN